MMNSILARNRDVINQLLREAKEAYTREDQNRVAIYTCDQCVFIAQPLIIDARLTLTASCDISTGTTAGIGPPPARNGPCRQSF
jgi:hypothetical protein